MIMQIGVNGIVSFNERLQYTDGYLNSLPTATICGLWEDVNGQYYTHAFYTELTAHWHSEIFAVSKAHALNLLREGFGGSLEGFDPTHLLLLTWDFRNATTKEVSYLLYWISNFMCTTYTKEMHYRIYSSQIYNVHHQL